MRLFGPTVSSARYTVCTGPSPSGGAYCTGSPGGSSRADRAQAIPRKNAPTDASTSTKTTATLRPNTLSYTAGHGSVVCAGGGVAIAARTVIPVRGGRFDAVAVITRLPAPVRVHGPSTAPPAPVSASRPALHCTWPESLGSVMRTAADRIRISQPCATTFQSNTDWGGEAFVPSVVAKEPAPRAGGEITPGTV